MRLWSVKEAEAVLPEVQEYLNEARAADAMLQESHAQLEDLRTIYPDIENPSCTAHDEYVQWQVRHKEGEDGLERSLLRFHALGVEVKDIVMGLVDFRCVMADEEVVFLCWREGEKRIGWWHPLQGGFATRKKLPDWFEANA